MRHQELAEQLERLGSLPAPLPDPRRVNEWERVLCREFVVQTPRASRSVADTRARRQVVVAAIALLAAASTTVLVLHRQSRHPFALDAASGAVLLLPDGSTHPLRAGDHVPPGGIIHTGPDGSVTIRGTKVGPGQAVLVDDGRLVLLPALPTSTVPTPPRPTTTLRTPTSAKGAARGRTVAPATAPTVVPATPASVPSSSVLPETATPTSAAPRPAAVTVATLELTIAREVDGVRLSWTTTDAATFERYVVVRGTTDTTKLTVVAEFPDRQITSFTDPAAPQNADVVYRVIALDLDGRPVAMSGTAMLEIGASSSSTTTSQAPTLTEPPPTDTTVPSETTTPPPATDTPSTDATTSIHRDHRRPSTTAVSSVP